MVRVKWVFEVIMYWKSLRAVLHGLSTPALFAYKLSVRYMYIRFRE